MLVEAVGLEDDILPEHQRGRGLLRLVTIGLTLLRAINAAEADTFRVVVVQDFNHIVVEDGDDGPDEVERKDP